MRLFAHNKLGLSGAATVILSAGHFPPASTAELLNLTQSEHRQPVLTSTSVALIVSSSLALIVLADLLAYKRYHKGLIHLH